MEENENKVAEEAPQETVEQTPVEETKFESAGDDSVLKVDLSKPPTPKEDSYQTLSMTRPCLSLQSCSVYFSSECRVLPF